MDDATAEDVATMPARAVVCDDDALVRSVIQRVLADASFEVVGEADSPHTALEVIGRYRPDVIVVDLALRAGSGEDVIREVRAEGDEVKIVVFSAYTSDLTILHDAGADAVVTKPDFEHLGRVFADLAVELDLPNERRRSVARVTSALPAPTTLSVSGLEAWRSFQLAADELEVGDAILCADVLPTADIQDDWDDVFRLDHRVTLGRVLAAGRRAQDHVSVTPEGVPVALIVAGHPEAPTAVFQRLAETWARDVSSGVPVGAFAVVHDGDQPAERLREAAAAVPTDHSEQLRMV
ncbi:MAG: response regulator transcription factor [Acidimicrobiales bacterium]|nr:response regulator transcription factor [Acidimicrobiales bacterium]